MYSQSKRKLCNKKAPSKPPWGFPENSAIGLYHVIRYLSGSDPGLRIGSVSHLGSKPRISARDTAALHSAVYRSWCHSFVSANVAKIIAKPISKRLKV